MLSIEKITILGIGLIGGSIALGLKEGGYRGTIVACDLYKETLEEAMEIGAVDYVTLDPGEAVKDSDLVIIALPLGGYHKLLEGILPKLKATAIVTDVGSVKGFVKNIVDSTLGKEIQFIGGHPMAGSDKGGIKAASSILFENAYYFIAPEENTKAETIVIMKDFIRTLKAYPVLVTPSEHDKIVAQISHLPHLLAVLLVNMLDSGNGISYLPFVGGGFRDSTRIAAGNPDIWRDIFLYNKGELIDGINSFQEILSEYKSMLASENETALLQGLKKARLLRSSIQQHAAGYMPPLYEIIVGVADKPGVIGELTGIIGENKLNIKEIEILHSREGEEGAIRIGFEKSSEVERAIDILSACSYKILYKRGER